MAPLLSATTPENAIAYINGRVYTVDESQPWAEAFIVSPSGIFDAVGSTDEILAKAKKDGLIVFDLRSQFVMPGIHDAHVHIFMGGLSRLSIASLGLENVIPASEAASQIKSAACRCQYAHAFSQYVPPAISCIGVRSGALGN